MMANKRDAANLIDEQTLLWMEYYKSRPVEYAEEVLKIKLTPQQKDMLNAYIKYDRLMVASSNSFGKTVVDTIIMLHHFECVQNSVTIVITPTKPSGIKSIFASARMLRPQLEFYPSEPIIERSPIWRAVLVNPSEDANLRGDRASTLGMEDGEQERSTIVIIDEAIFSDRQLINTAKTLLAASESRTFMLLTFNPTDTSSYIYELWKQGSDKEPMPGQFKLMSYSALEHPNVVAELDGKKPPLPGAVGVRFVTEMIYASDSLIYETEDECGEAPNTFYWPPLKKWIVGKGELIAAVLGKWAGTSEFGIWSQDVWERALKHKEELSGGLVVGVDPAGPGKDKTSIFIRRGDSALDYREYSHLSPKRIAEKARELAERYLREDEDIKDVVMHVDGDATGWAIEQDFSFCKVVRMAAASRPEDLGDYTILRDKLWFNAKERASQGKMDLSRLSKEALGRLQPQLFCANYKVVTGKDNGLRKVDAKSEMKKALRASPDIADALNLCYMDVKPKQTMYGEIKKGGANPFKFNFFQKPSPKSKEKPRRFTIVGQ
jgi:hypothetical protein